MFIAWTLLVNLTAIVNKLDKIYFQGKKIAYFRTEDRVKYAENFQDAMKILEANISGLGVQTFGYWLTNVYEHETSQVGKFIGLALDRYN